jgi:diguanylate cyclase (GGDEF)-like protein
MVAGTAAWKLPGVAQIGADQLSAVVRATTAALISGLVNAALVTVSFWSAVPPYALLAWFAFTASVSISFWLRRRVQRTYTAATLSRRAMARAVFSASLLALPWAILPSLYLGHLPHTTELVLITVSAGMAAGGSVLLAPVYPAALAYVAVVLLPFAVNCFALASAGYTLVGFLTLSYAAFLVAVIATTARLSVERTEALRALTQTTQLLRDRDALITTQNTRFETALNNMNQGLCFFDRNERLIVCNHRYIELYRLDPGRVQPGTLLSDILDMRVQAGTSPTSGKDDYLAWRDRVGQATVASDTIYKLNNGCIYAIHYRPMADGAWVATTDDITERQRLSEQLEQNHKKIAHMATHDALTGLPNRVLFRERLDEAVKAALAGDRGVAVMMLDLNRFKQVNDTLGHPVGDGLLIAVAERLVRCVREKDTVARLGGDEFGVVVHAVDPGVEAAGIAKRIQAALDAPFEIGDHSLCIGTSIGISRSSAEANDSDLLIKQADVALYRAKAEGGDRYRFYEVEVEDDEPFEAHPPMRRLVPAAL